MQPSINEREGRAVPESPIAMRMIPFPFQDTDESDDDIVERLAYQRCDDNDFDSTDEIARCGETTRQSCGRFAAFQEQLLGPISPERAPGVWMVLNVFCLSWSLSLGVYLMLCYVEYGNEVAASKATTTAYLVYSLLTTLVWVVEIALQAAFPGLDTVIVVSAPSSQSQGDGSDNGDVEQEEELNGAKQRSVEEQPRPQDFRDEEEDQELQLQQLSQTFTAEESAVALGTIVQSRSKQRWTVLIIELLLAVFFGIETVLDCWKHWNYRHGFQEMEISNSSSSSNNNNDDAYYLFGDDDEDGPGRYSMLQQQSDIWINVLAYAYMTYHTYHEYYRSKTTSMDIRRSVSTTLLSQQAMQEQQQQTNRHVQPPPTMRYHQPRQNPSPSPNATVRTTILTRSILTTDTTYPLPPVRSLYGVETQGIITASPTASPIHNPPAAAAAAAKQPLPASVPKGTNVQELTPPTTVVATMLSSGREQTKQKQQAETELEEPPPVL